MHELAVMEGVVDAVVAKLGDRRVATVRLEIGTLAAVDLDALQFCFEICTHETTLAGARLDIIPILARARCGSCGAEFELASWLTPCRCGGFERELLTGDELRLKEVEVL